MPKAKPKATVSVNPLPAAAAMAENRHFKIYPTEAQVHVLRGMQRAYQLWWNQILEWTLADFESRSLKIGMAGLAQYGKFMTVYRNSLKRMDPDNPMLLLSTGSISMIIKKQLQSWSMVFDGLKEQKKTGIASQISKPRFKSHCDVRSESIPFVFDKRFAATAVNLEGSKSQAWISVPLLAKGHNEKRLAFALSDTLSGEIGSFTIHRKASGWMICLNVTGIKSFDKPWLSKMKHFEDPETDVESFLQGGIGFDASVRNRLVSSDPTLGDLGKIDISPRDKEKLRILERKKAHKLRYAKLQAGLAANQPLQKGQRLPRSKRYRKLDQQCEKIREHYRNSNKDALHKYTTTAIQNHAFIAVEDLSLLEMTRSLSRGFRRSLHQAAMAECIKQLEYKAARYNRAFVKVGKYFASSKLCSTIGCDYKNTPLRLSDTVWTCPQCNITHQRDLNAAMNIRQEGLRLILKQSEILPGNASEQTAGSAAVTDVSHLEAPNDVLRKATTGSSMALDSVGFDVKKLMPCSPLTGMDPLKGVA